MTYIFHLAVHVFQGMEMVFRIAVAILQTCQEDLLALDMEGLLKVSLMHYWCFQGVLCLGGATVIILIIMLLFCCVCVLSCNNSC